MKRRARFMATGLILAALEASWGQPVITNQPLPQATAPGTTVTFQVGASGIEPLGFQWQRSSGNDFSDLANRTNALLVLTNVQPWDASDYRVVVANSTGARTSAVARLYDTAAVSHFSRNWSVINGQTVELRVDLVGMDEHATGAGMDLWSGGSNGGYALFKGNDFIHLCKPSLSVAGIHGQFFHERVLVKNTNVVLALAITRVNPNVILTARVLDKDNNNAVLYERSVVDTPGVDRTLTQAEMEAASGMHMNAGTDVGPPITSGSEVFLSLFQYTDGTRPAAEVIYDNLERWTSVFPVWRPELAIHVSNNSPKVNLTLSAAPNSSWTIERALSLTGPWTSQSVLLIGTNGSAQFQDTNPPAATGFYRARQE